MTDAEKLQKIRELLIPPAMPEPLPQTMEDKLRALAADWCESDAHQAYGETILDILDGK